MKKYVILTPSIINVGGAQIYVNNKVEYLKTKDWNVDVYYVVRGATTFGNLKLFEDNCFEELIYKPYYYSCKTICHLLDTLVSSVISDHVYEQIIIESHTTTLSYWGELLAKRLNAKHIVYNLNEIPSITSDKEFDFLNFKLKRRELAGITKKSLPIMFEKYRNISENEMYYLNANCANAAADCYNLITDQIVRCDYNIGSIGRLDKPFVPYMIDEVAEFARSNKNKSILFVLIGASTDGEKETIIKEYLGKISNIKLVITGYMYPIPRDLISKLDVFISSAGSVYVSAAEGVPTIVINADNYKPIGIYGYTTNSIFFSDLNIDNTTSELLKEILINKCCDKLLEKPEIDMYNNVAYDEHMKFLDDSEKTKIYFPVIKIKPQNKEAVLVILYKLLGRKPYDKIIQKYHKYKHMIKRRKHEK